MSTIAERVAAGAEWLDAQERDWFARVDLDKLELGDCARCVLGQVFGAYWDGVHLLLESDSDSEDLAAEHGFNLTEDEYESGIDGVHFHALAQAWTELITVRRAGEVS